MSRRPLALGLDFGTESVRAVLLSLDGRLRGSGSASYPHGQIVSNLPAPRDDVELDPATTALQHPGDWPASARRAIAEALDEARAVPEDLVGIGIDFTSCTVLPTLADGTPLCEVEGLERRPHAWPKLWKHHGAADQADAINALARARQAPWLERYGGTVGLEWLWPKLLEVYDDDREVFDRMAVWLEAGDWMVWRLTGGAADSLPRSTCQAGYKACWSPGDGHLEADFLEALSPGFSAALDRLPGRHLAPGTRAGTLDAHGARWLGLAEGTPVSAAIIDAHAAVPGVDAVRPGVFVMVLGTSACHMLNTVEPIAVPGVAGIVEDGILPGLVGYEMGQPAVGDAFAWLQRLTGRELDALAEAAGALPEPIGVDDPLYIDWLAGNRTPLMDGRLRGALTGLNLATSPAELYRAVAEGTALGCRWIVERLEAHGVEVDQVVATGGLAHRAPLLVELLADVLGRAITVHPSTQASARGAAMLGALAGTETSGASVTETLESMAVPRDAAGYRVVQPDPTRRDVCEARYATWRRLTDHLVQESLRV